MAMLGLVHRKAIGTGAPHFRRHFQIEFDGKLKDLRAKMKGPLVARSALGLVAVYNRLPESCRRNAKRQIISGWTGEATVGGMLPEFAKYVVTKRTFDETSTAEVMVVIVSPASVR